MVGITHTHIAYIGEHGGGGEVKGVNLALFRIVRLLDSCIHFTKSIQWPRSAFQSDDADLIANR